MIAAVDVHYRDPKAVAACILFAHWQAADADREIVEVIDWVEPYVSGKFYRRELPCILEVLAKCPLAPEIVVIDGHVWLGGENNPGLGAHLYEALGRRAAVVGVAKSRFSGAGPLCEIYRGDSKKPLFVSATGMPLDQVSAAIERMHGDCRIPTLLRRVDALSRTQVLTRSAL